MVAGSSGWMHWLQCSVRHEYKQFGTAGATDSGGALSAEFPLSSEFTMNSFRVVRAVLIACFLSRGGLAYKR